MTGLRQSLQRLAPGFGGQVLDGAFGIPQRAGRTASASDKIGEIFVEEQRIFLDEAKLGWRGRKATTNA